MVAKRWHATLTGLTPPSYYGYGVWSPVNNAKARVCSGMIQAVRAVVSYVLWHNCAAMQRSDLYPTQAHLVSDYPGSGCASPESCPATDGLIFLWVRGTRNSAVDQAWCSANSVHHPQQSSKVLSPLKQPRPANSQDAQIFPE